MAAATTQSGGLIANEHPFSQSGAGRFNDSFFGNTIGMVARSDGRLGTFRSAFDGVRDLRKLEVWIRVAEVYNGANVPAGATGFLLGLESKNGAVAWVDSDGVGGLPRPLDRRAWDLNDSGKDRTKTMPKTLRFPIECFRTGRLPRRRFDPRQVQAMLLRLSRGDGRALAFDDAQIVQR